MEIDKEILFYLIQLKVPFALVGERTDSGEGSQA